MKKLTFFIGLFSLLFLAWTMSCQSPSSTGNPSSSKLANDNQSSQNDNNDSSNDDTSDSDTSADRGFLRLFLKDAPIDEAKNIWVKISNIRAHRACDEEEDCFTTIWENPTGQDIDLLALKTDPFALPTAELPAGTYNQIRMAVISGEIVFASTDPTDPTDLRFPLIVPSDEVKTHLHFELLGGETIRITLDLDAKKSIHVIKRGNKDVYQLRPVVEVVAIEEETGG